MQELDRAKIIEAYAKSEITGAVAALRLQISTRQVRRLQAWFAVVGVSGMISGRRGVPSLSRRGKGRVARTTVPAAGAGWLASQSVGRGAELG
jgi:hypothetical protein